MDIKELQTKVLVQCYQRLGGPKGPPDRDPNIKEPQTSLFCLHYSGEIIKSKNERLQ